MRISDWSSGVCSSDLGEAAHGERAEARRQHRGRAGIEAPDAPEAKAVHQLHRRRGQAQGPWRPRGERGALLTSAEERRVGEWCVSRFRSRGSPYHYIIYVSQKILQPDYITHYT